MLVKGATGVRFSLPRMTSLELIEAEWRIYASIISLSLVQIRVCHVTPAPYRCIDQCWNIINLTPRNKLQWNFNRNSYMCIQENPFKNVVCKMLIILHRHQCVIRWYQKWVVEGPGCLKTSFSCHGSWAYTMGRIDANFASNSRFI